MSKAPTTFRQRDVTAACRGVSAAGFLVVRVEIDKQGKIVVITSPEAPDERREGSQWADGELS